MCSIPLTAAWEIAKAGPAPGDRAVPEAGTDKSQELEPELSLSVHSCLTRTRSLPVALGSDAGFNLVSKHLLFKGLVEVPVLLLFWCLCHMTPPCFCIYLFPSSCRSHAVLTWPGTSPGTSSARPSLGIPSPEKPPSAETGAQRRGRGPHVLVPCCRASPISPAPTPLPRSFSTRGLSLFSWFPGESSRAPSPAPPPGIPSWFRGAPGVQCCPSPVLFLGGVCVHARAFPPGTICILLSFKVPVLPPRKEINDVKEFTSQVSKAAGPSGFICCREVWGCRGAAMGWRVHSWCPSCPWPQVQGRQSQLCSQPLSWHPGSEVPWWTGTHVSDCGRCQRSPSQGGVRSKTTSQGQPGGVGAPNRLLCSSAWVGAGCEQWGKPP